MNYWTLYAFRYQLVLRYRDFHKKLAGLVGRHAPGHYGKFKPSRKSNGELIIREWSAVQRIMASLGQKQVSQATIVRKLASYKRQNQTKKALRELDNLCRTRHILQFINDVGLRQSIQKTLNRGEAYHRLRRAVAFVNGGKLRVYTEAEQQLWNECACLIANATIHYNTALLSRLHEHKRAMGDEAEMAFIASMSPVAWRYVNLFGAMDFGAATMPVDIDALASVTPIPSTAPACCRRQPKRTTRKADPASGCPGRHRAVHGGLVWKGFEGIFIFRGMGGNSHAGSSSSRFAVARIACS
ncbi:Transposase and inactivated derivatives TnpA family-like protein [Burkholderia ambifaria MEX-5]|uniref:Transposase and inactivated derivatives TnpA family-like protein n=1 Tax=Burkholderia ambifaria MEX-5 TaxID=396597 RepID=B1T4G3_9BURK|nr:Tn3 family transposase [Burkholderia ambifaria]EDT41561.1 Transposase and inactivated derivatives TnpA family-like protein [Burkholderia ambifaria MEX-5]